MIWNVKKFLYQRTLETVSRSIEQLGIKVGKRTLNNKRLVIIAFVLANIELPLMFRFIKWFLNGYITTVVNKIIDDLISMLKVSKKKKC